MAVRSPYGPKPDIRSAIRARGMTISDAARAIGRHPQYLAKTLRGVFPLSEPLARDLGDLLDLDLTEEREHATAS